MKIREERAERDSAWFYFGGKIYEFQPHDDDDDDDDDEDDGRTMLAMRRYLYIYIRTVVPSYSEPLHRSSLINSRVEVFEAFQFDGRT